MRKKRLIFCLVIAAIPCCSQAFAQDLYHQAAKGFLAFLSSPKAIVAIDILKENSLNPVLEEIESGALVRLEDGGYILIAPGRSLTPIKAYSLTRPFNDLPPAVQEYLRREMEGNARLVREHDVRGARRIMGFSENETRWDFLLNFEASRHALAYVPDTWLLKTTWNQNHPYNKLTPRIDGVPTYAGCVNTAMAQIMKYYQYPDAARGVASYDWNGQNLKAVLYKAYNWDHMPENPDAATPAWQADQVASLISDIGIANRTLYDTRNSSASIEIENMIRHFGYSKNLSSLSNSNVGLFFEKLKAEIDAARPVLLSLPGHMVVADGYRSETEDPTGRNIHLNMGWGGNHNDFYYLDADIDLEGTGFSFETSPGALFIYYPVMPCSGADCDWASVSDPDASPVISSLLPDRVLQAEQDVAARMFLDVRSESGEPLSIQADSSNRSAVQAQVSSGVLSLSTGAGGEASMITVKAEAGGKTTQQSFVVMTLDQDVGYGKAFESTGRFTHQEEVYEHSVILDGPCTIRGDRGYSNQAFFMAVFDSEGNKVSGWTDESIQASLPKGLYTLSASLRNPDTFSYYPYESGVQDGYVMVVSCPDADHTVQTVAHLLDVDLSGIDYGIDLAGVILALQVISEAAFPDADLGEADFDGDGRIGLIDAIYGLQFIAGL